MESLKIIRDNFHSQFLNIRNCNNLIQGDDFEVAYKAATPEDRRHIKKAIAEYDKNLIKKFIDTQILKLSPFEKLGIRKLREIGQNLRISNYYSMSKSDLIEEIKNVVSRLKANGERVPFQSEQTGYFTENINGCGQPEVLDN